MRVMVLVRATENSEAGVSAGEELHAAMMRFNEELVDAGVLVAGEGLHPSARGARVVFAGGDTTVVDGPFPAAELIAGFWLWEVADMAEAIAWARRCPPPMPGEQAVLEIRPVLGADDFGEEVTPALRAQEERLRAVVERRRKG